ncbi:hypothetical protein J6590_014308 [Homalodisca vitripennis]|nr:hypothetical protein J6590_014308 [Homalodisca vitripennis]
MSGVYLRRVMLFFDKLNFSQTVSLYRGFQHYVLRGRQRQMDEVKCNLFKSSPSPPSPLASTSMMDLSSSMEQTSCSIAQDMQRVRYVYKLSTLLVFGFSSKIYVV